MMLSSGRKYFVENGKNLIYKKCKSNILQLLENMKALYNESAKYEIPDKTKGVIEHDR